jgi:hypothetical protein
MSVLDMATPVTSGTHKFSKHVVYTSLGLCVPLLLSNKRVLQLQFVRNMSVLYMPRITITVRSQHVSALHATYYNNSSFATCQCFTCHVLQ